MTKVLLTAYRHKCFTALRGNTPKRGESRRRPDRISFHGLGAGHGNKQQGLLKGGAPRGLGQAMVGLS